MKREISNGLIWIINKLNLIDYIYEYYGDKASKEEELKHWYKARRLGYRKKDMGEYYYDLRRAK